ncbi:hypothetical protein MMC09_006478 [Bachmanniomyces sp. S44760]|nr:hypothetical protein [Bachmanniomyces sp. S44760]
MASLLARLQALGIATPAIDSRTLTSQRSSKTSTLVEPELLQTSEVDQSKDQRSRATSVTASHNTRRSIHRSKTSFHLAHPPPLSKHKQRLKVRPKLLLQLQQLSDTHRPVPALDVLPSAVFAPRLARRFPRIFNGRTGLGIDDLIVVSSQTYDSPDENNIEEDDISGDEKLDQREVVAAICSIPNDDDEVASTAEIYLNYGHSWRASRYGNGGYEFTSVDEQGHLTTARWVPSKSGRSRAPSNAANEPPATGSPTKDNNKRKFVFSILNPMTRQHPIIATMDHRIIEIFDHFQSVSSPSSPNIPPPSPDAGAEEGRQDYLDILAEPIKTSVPTDEHMRTLIIVSGIWVSFMERWSDHFTYSSRKVSQDSFSAIHTHRQRHSVPSINLDQGPINRANTPSSMGSTRTRNLSLSILNRPTLSKSPNHSPCSGGAGPAGGLSPQRSNSTGAAFLRRANKRNDSLNTFAKAMNQRSFDGSVGQESTNLDSMNVPNSKNDKSSMTRSSTAYQSRSSPAQVFPGLTFGDEIAPLEAEFEYEPQSVRSSTEISQGTNSGARTGTLARKPSRMTRFLNYVGKKESRAQT